MILFFTFFDKNAIGQQISKVAKKEIYISFFAENNDSLILKKKNLVIANCKPCKVKKIGENKFKVFVLKNKLLPNKIFAELKLNKFTSYKIRFELDSMSSYRFLLSSPPTYKKLQAIHPIISKHNIEVLKPSPDLILIQDSLLLLNYSLKPLNHDIIRLTDIKQEHFRDSIATLLDSLETLLDNLDYLYVRSDTVGFEPLADVDIDRYRNRIIDKKELMDDLYTELANKRALLEKLDKIQIERRTVSYLVLSLILTIGIFLLLLALLRVYKQKKQPEKLKPIQLEPSEKKSGDISQDLISLEKLLLILERREVSSSIEGAELESFIVAIKNKLRSEKRGNIYDLRLNTNPTESDIEKIIEIFGE